MSTSVNTPTHAAEVSRGERFRFGDNWSRFLTLLNDDRIRSAEQSLRDMLEVQDLNGRTFLDIGSGSGLFSLAARRLGAKVFSFDFDPSSVACTTELRRRYFPEDQHWTVQQGSALDADYVKSLGKFDIVYSWGVLHHTGNMWLALENAALAAGPQSTLFVAIYNDTGTQARRWVTKKKIYNQLPGFLQTPFAIAVTLPDEIKMFSRSLLYGELGSYFKTWSLRTDDPRARGMSKWYDIIDWVGGYPYEYATADEIFDFYRKRGFTMTRLRSGYVGLGCNEFVFQKVAVAS